MTLRVKLGGTWQTVQFGSLRVKESPDNPLLREFTPDMWVSPSKILVKLGDVWKDIGYTPAAGQPGTVSVKTWSFATVTVAWTVPVTGVPPLSYSASLYLQNGTKAGVVSVASTDPLEASFDVVNSTNYYVVITSHADNASSTDSLQLKIRTGRPEATHTETRYDWSTSEDVLRPTALSETSRYGDDYSVAAAVDVGDGAWVSAGREAKQAMGYHVLWEGIELSLPNQQRKLTKVNVLTEPNHTVLLGIKASGVWLGYPYESSSLASVGWPNDEYARILLHNYAMWADTGTAQRVIDVEHLDVDFSEVELLNFALSNFVNLYGGSAAGATGSHAVNVPWEYNPVVIGGKTVKLIKGTHYLTYDDVGLSGGEVTAEPIPPGSVVWRANTSLNAWYVALGSGMDITWKFVNDNTPLLYSSGVPATMTVAELFNPLGYVTGTAVGTPKTEDLPAWRARIHDVTVSFKEWVPSGIKTVVDQTHVNTVSGPSSW